MENIRRSIKLFFVTYGSLLFQIIGIIVVILFSIRGINSLYEKNATEKTVKNELLQEETEKEQQIKEKEKEDISFISEFLNYCNNKKIEEAYNMLSEECIKDIYETIEKFENEYVNKIFTYKKEYKIEKENDLYKIIILDGVLESGSLENRKSVICYYEIEQNVLGKTINILERE